MDPHSNLQLVRKVFNEESAQRGLKGVMGVSDFGAVLRALMPMQQRRLEELRGGEPHTLKRDRSVISIAYAYPEYAIDAIALLREGKYDKRAWNIYAGWYHRLNETLNATAGMLASETGGLAVPATTEGLGGEIKHVEDYYGMVVSHRVAAEHSGVGWRGKNELIVNPIYSCAIRLASVVTDLPLERTTPLDESCGDCRACLNACSFLRFKDRLNNYREQCRRYINSLGLEDAVCGKCIKACYREGIYREQFNL
jgi:epoxyqueuosine reductase QueG